MAKAALMMTSDRQLPVRSAKAAAAFLVFAASYSSFSRPLAQRLEQARLLAVDAQRVGDVDRA